MKSTISACNPFGMRCANLADLKQTLSSSDSLHHARVAPCRPSEWMLQMGSKSQGDTPAAGGSADSPFAESAIAESFADSATLITLQQLLVAAAKPGAF